MKKVYETPFTTHVRVEMESAFMKASVVDDKKEGVTVEATPQDNEVVDVSESTDFSWE